MYGGVLEVALERFCVRDDLYLSAHRHSDILQFFLFFFLMDKQKSSLFKNRKYLLEPVKR